MQHAHSKPHQEKRKIDRAITQIGRKIIVDADMALNWQDTKAGTQIGGTETRRNITPSGGNLWHASRLDLSGRL